MKTLNLIAAAAAALLLSSCSGNPGVTVVAHRGFWNCDEAGYARNSVAALRCACEAGFRASEFDVHISSDSILVVHHDGIIDGKRIEEYPLSEFSEHRLENGEPLPTLEDYFRTAVAYPHTALVLELKEHSTPELEKLAVEKSIELLKEYGLFSPDRVLFISFSIYACEQYAKAAPGFTVQYLEHDYSIAELAERGINGVDTEYGWVLEHPEWMEQAKAAGFSTNVWTVDDMDAARRLIDLGVEQITTNKPDQLRELLKELGIKESR